MTENEELKPCPFCGGRAYIQGRPRADLTQSEHKVGFAAGCFSVSCVSPYTEKLEDIELLKKLWNTRTGEK